MREKGFTLLEILVVTVVVGILAVLVAIGARKVYVASSLAVSANNIRLLSAGGINYLAEHDHVFWPYLTKTPEGSTWWFGYEGADSAGRLEGERTFDPLLGPLGEYVPKSIRPDPSLGLGAKAFKSKYKNGYIGIGYNVALGGGWLGATTRQNQMQLQKPGQIVVFATSAQVNTFQSPATPTNPMLEEFYGLEPNERTVHFRHHGNAMVSYASGNADFIPIDPATKSKSYPEANIGRLDKKYLVPTVE